MISLLTMCSNPEDGTSFYRGVNPLGRIKQATGNLEVLLADKISWTEVALADMAFFQRPASGQHVGVANLVKDWGLPLWVDYDDDVFNVPEDNPAYQIYSRAETRAAVRHCIAIADRVTVSTEDLKRKFLELNPNVQVIPNAIDSKLLSYRKELPRSETPTVLWRGTITHRRDLEVFENQIISSVRATGARIYFQGHAPKKIMSSLPASQCTANEFMHVWSFHRFIHDMVRPHVTIVPLEDTTFNRAKSNIAWIESIFAGAPALAPDWEEWRRPGCITYKDQNDFQDKLEWLLSNPEECRNQARLGWEYITENLRLDRVNLLRSAVMEELVQRARFRPA